MSEHTPEPWPEFESVAMKSKVCDMDVVKLGVDNYNHARSCVNACANMSNDELEDHGVGGIKQWMDNADEMLKAVCDALEDVDYSGRCEQGIYVLKKQRDELLALALEIYEFETQVAMPSMAGEHILPTRIFKKLEAIAKAQEEGSNE